MSELADDIRSALEASGLLDLFEKMPPSHQQEHLKYINEAKQPETRQHRIEKTIEFIRNKSV